MFCRDCDNYSHFGGFCNLHKISCNTINTCKHFVAFGGSQIKQNYKPYYDHVLIRALCDVEEVKGYTDIFGGVSIYNSTLYDLSGLESITYIGEDLEILSNDGLRSLNGLQNILTVKGNLVIRNNRNLSLDDIEKFVKRITVSKTTWVK